MFVTSIVTDGNGIVWAGAEEDGLYRMTLTDNKWVKDEAFSKKFGENVFALEVSRDGLLWVGTLDCGVCTWDGKSWQSYGMKEGLPGNRVFALTQTLNSGMLLATDGGIANWNTKKGLIETYDRTLGLLQNEANGIAVCGQEMLVATQCFGLMCRPRSESPFVQVDEMKNERCNALVELSNGDMAVGTAAGLWIRVKGAKKWKKLPQVDKYVTTILQDAFGRIYVGTRQNGVVVLDNSYRIQDTYLFGGVSNRISALGVDQRKLVLAGTYGGGVVRLPGKGHSLRRTVRKQQSVGHPVLPLEKIFRVKKPVQGNKSYDCFYLADDWATKGDWCGRYGARYALLCSMDAPWGNHRMSRDYGYFVGGRIGEHHREDDVLRHWVHWVITENRNSLYAPKIGYRRQAEWDDHSETYPPSWDGPDLIISVTVTTGWHRVAFYFNNKDGHEGENFRRDYTIEVDDGTEEKVRSRVAGFRNGVYKVFALKGPTTKEFRIRRNGSFSTILSGVFIDRFFEPRESQDCPRHTTYLYYGGVVYSPPKAEGFSLPKLTAYTPVAFDLWARQVRRDYQSAAEENKDEAVLANYRWTLREWTLSDHQLFDHMMLLAWTGFQFMQPIFRHVGNAAHSPNVSRKPVEQADFRSKGSDEWTKRRDVLNPKPIDEPKKGFFLKLREIQRETNRKAEF